MISLERTMESQDYVYIDISKERTNKLKLDFSKVSIYVLQLQEGKFYIGKTSKNVCERYR